MTFFICGMLARRFGRYRTVSSSHGDGAHRTRLLQKTPRCQAGLLLLKTSGAKGEMQDAFQASLCSSRLVAFFTPQDGGVLQGPGGRTCSRSRGTGQGCRLQAGNISQNSHPFTGECSLCFEEWHFRLRSLQRALGKETLTLEAAEVLRLKVRVPFIRCALESFVFGSSCACEPAARPSAWTSATKWKKQPL